MKAIIALFAFVSVFIVFPQGALAQESGDGSEGAPVMAPAEAEGEPPVMAPAGEDAAPEGLAPAGGGADADEGVAPPPNLAPGQQEAKGCFLIWCWGDYDGRG